MYKTIMLVVEGAPQEAEATDAAEQLARHGSPSSKVHLVARTAPPHVIDAPPVMVSEFVQWRAWLEAHVEEVSARLRSSGIDASSQAVRGSRHLLLDLAKEIRADIVVVGTGGHALMECGLRGCTACFLAKRASCSVLVVR
jgi:nucleotide-binding universal stress UspA family protein